MVRERILPRHQTRQQQIARRAEIFYLAFYFVPFDRIP